ncbi:MAG TPA: hypothetical protein DC047_04580 [Blastocatellia bacterium]|nr:hypothetical protein [Blastocatellia bacterium]
MRVYDKPGRTLSFAFALALVCAAFVFATSHVDYRFKVHNNTKVAIKKILVSEDGKKYGYFDIGAGIAAGDTEELVWDKSTDEGNCGQFFKAVFANGEESDPVEFDFCEKDLTLEFN